MTDKTIQKLMELSELAFRSIENFPQKRFLFPLLKKELNNKSIVILAGPRGVGKTILLKQLLCKKLGAFYLSVDQLEKEASLFELAQLLEKNHKIKYLILDEIHYNHNYSVDLKAMYDFLKLKIFITSSIALKLEKLSVDLSRRSLFYQLFPFSFREYIFFETTVLIKPLTLNELLKKKWTHEHVRYGHLFKNYLSGRLYPFTLHEKNFEDLFRSILNKIINMDLPQIANLTQIDVLKIHKLLAFIARSPIDTISITSLSKNIGITKYKVEEYLRLLEQAYLIQILYPKGTNVSQEPKILMTLPYRLLFKNYDDSIGCLREEFVISSLRVQNLMSINYLKSTRGQKIPDFFIEDSTGTTHVIEVGGKSKGRSQFKGVTVDKKYVFVDSLQWKENQYPLFLMGMY